MTDRRSDAPLSRRTLMLGAGALPLLAACGNPLGSGNASRIDARVQGAVSFMQQEVPGTRELVNNAAGMLVMPLVTEAGFGFGGAYGRGALLINGATVDYYSALSGSFGLQIGAQQYAHTLFFMTPEALSQFRNSVGWSVGADVRYALNTDAATLGFDTASISEPVVAVVYGQAGLIVGATLDGTRYTRIIP
ncbi:YSC84-related protein [Gymnodinialimonas sp. 2305UL16-5]|uniref:lipid-binding SYLF domain-containing protein n=1 Tax=Gymnodinialimonas mytili TaxID=3126503 RepID=UPI0030B60F4C